MNKKSLLIMFNHFFMSYKDFLYNNKELKINDEDLDTISFLFASLSFILNAESIKTQDEDPDEYLSQDILNNILTVIATHKEDGFYISNQFVTSNSEELIKIIRNKIAHGAFSLDNSHQYIILDHNFQEYKIKIQDFIAFTIYLVDRISLYTTSKKYIRNNLYANTESLKAIRSSQDIPAFLSNIYYVEYEFTDVNPYDKDKIEQIMHIVPEFLVTYEKTTHQRITSLVIKQLFSSYGIQVNPSIKPLSNTEDITTLQNFITEHLPYIQDFDVPSEVSLISNWFYKIKRNDNQSENIREGIIYNLQLLNELKKHQYSNVDDILTNSSSSGFQNSLLEMLVTSELLGFYIHYHYPLENLCKSKENSYDDTFFDCSKLDLSFIKPSLYILPEGQKNSYLDAERGTKRRLEEVSRKISSAQKQKDNLIAKLSQSSKDANQNNIITALNHIQEQLGYLEDQETKELANLEIIEKNLAEFSLSTQDSYHYNRYLIEYIRNAIAHGNVEFNYNSSLGNYQKCILHFTNSYQGQQLFDLEISIQDFEKLFSSSNIAVLNDYLTSLTSTKKGKSLN